MTGDAAGARGLGAAAVDAAAARRHRRDGEREGRRPQPQPRGDDAHRPPSRARSAQSCGPARPSGLLLRGGGGACCWRSFRRCSACARAPTSWWSGIGFNIFALGATTFAYRQIFGGLSREQIPVVRGGRRCRCCRASRFLGPALFQQTGLRLRRLPHRRRHLVAGDPNAVRARPCGRSARTRAPPIRPGIPVERIRFLAVLYAGGCAGLAGVFISVASISTFTEGMTNGAGYLAVTAVILGGWGSAGVLGACLLFGGGDVAAVRAAGAGRSHPDGGAGDAARTFWRWWPCRA